MCERQFFCCVRFYMHALVDSVDKINFFLSRTASYKWRERAVNMSRLNPVKEIRWIDYAGKTIFMEEGRSAFSFDVATARFFYGTAIYAG